MSPKLRRKILLKAHKRAEKLEKKTDDGWGGQTPMGSFFKRHTVGPTAKRRIFMAFVISVLVLVGLAMMVGLAMI